MGQRGPEPGATRAAVERLHAADPDATMADIAREIGVSRERVRQHLKALGLRSHRRRPNFNPRRHGPHKIEARVLTGGVSVSLSAPVAGTIGELLAAADLMARGFAVYAPIHRHHALYDLIAVRRSGLMASIEVRCGKRSKGGAVSYRKGRDSKATHFAVVITGEPVLYFPDLPS